MKEYELLREEMMEDYRAISNYNIALYSVVAAVFGLSLTQNVFYLSLTVYIAILPLFLLCESKRKNICFIAAYMAVYLEGEDFNWETRHQVYEKKYAVKRNWHSLFPYYFVGTLCSALSIIKLLFSDQLAILMIVISIVICIITIAVFAYMRKQSINYVNLRQEMKAQWEKVKSSESAITQ